MKEGSFTFHTPFAFGNGGDQPGYMSRHFSCKNLPAQGGKSAT